MCRWVCVYVCERRLPERGVGDFEEHTTICGLCVRVFLKGVYQSIFTGPCLVRYEGRAALPHPPINII